MRNFLTDKVIIGATLCSRAGKLVEYCLGSLLKNCDKILIVLDNPDDATKTIVENYAKKYTQIEIIFSPFPCTSAEEDEAGIKRRFKNLQGEIRDLIFKRLREMYGNGEKIDLVLFPDSDEMFSDNLPNLLCKFVDSNFKAIVMKAVDVFGNFDAIHREGMTGHVRILKYFPELTALPYRWRTNYMPLRREDKMGDDFTLIHLSLLTPESLDWKIRYWQADGEEIKKWPLWRTGKDVRQCVAGEIHEILKRNPDMTVSEFLRGGDKWLPVGVTNAHLALQEASGLLDKMCIRHYLAFGTCLGAVRDGKLIPLDWDVDLIMNGEDLHKFDRQLVLSNGFGELKIKSDIPSWIRDDGTKSSELFTRTISFKKFGVRVDIDPAYISEDEKSRIILKGRKRQQFAAVHPREWFDNAVKIELNSHSYLVPASVDKYLESNYGSGWRTPQFGHRRWEERQCMCLSYACKKI